MLYLHNGVLLSLQNEGHSAPATTWMNLKDIMQMSQPQKNEYRMMPIT